MYVYVYAYICRSKNAVSTEQGPLYSKEGENDEETTIIFIHVEPIGAHWGFECDGERPKWDSSI